MVQSMCPTLTTEQDVGHDGSIQSLLWELNVDAEICPTLLLCCIVEPVDSARGKDSMVAYLIWRLVL